MLTPEEIVDNLLGLQLLREELERNPDNAELRSQIGQLESDLRKAIRIGGGLDAIAARLIERGIADPRDMVMDWDWINEDA